MVGLLGFVYLGVSNFLSGFHDKPNGITYVFSSLKNHYWCIFSGVIGCDVELCVWDVGAVVCHQIQKAFFCALYPSKATFKYTGNTNLRTAVSILQ